nr:PREDICTED: uncharacterized protein LOC100141764 [Tribolium castaneum]|eukprot:XP_001807041.2 PREDICTED: uncharacterized protein LOC100141764 [Tribolium castaneum]
MSASLSDEQNKLVKKVAESQGFKDYKIDVQAGSLKGDGYLGIINIVKIWDNSKELNLVIKSALSGKQLREQAPVRKAYEREIYMYTTIFPEFEKLSRERSIKNSFREIAKCYGSFLKEYEECLILENLKEIDYKLWNRKIPMNADHVALGFATYGKFHGTGLALKYLKPELYQEMSKNLKNIFYSEEETPEEKAKFAESSKLMFGNGFKAVAGNAQATQALTRFTQQCEKFFGEDVKRIDKYSTILHGDCWCNNMMYKYMDKTNPGKPTEMCFLDWQIAHIGSPIFDLAYFFCANSGKEVLYDIENFLKIYHENLSATIQQAGLNPEEVFSFEELQCQWKHYARFGLFMALFVMRVILSEVDEVPDLSKCAEEGKDILQSISSSKASNNEEINKRITDIAIFMDEFGYLSSNNIYAYVFSTTGIAKMTTNVQLKLKLNTLLTNAAKNLNIQKFSIDLDLCALKGDGFLCEIYKAAIIDQETNKKINVVIKVAPSDQRRREATCIQEAYSNEILFYSEVFPVFIKFQQEHKTTQLFNNVPRYITSAGKLGEEMIVLADITKAGFIMRDKNLALDEEHAKLIFKTYGRFHAISFCLKDQNFEVYKNLTKKLVNVPAVFGHRDGFCRGLKGMAGKAFKILDPNLQTVFKKYEENTVEMYLKVLKYEGKYSCILHGDCWSNNMMFKYQNSQIVDVQMMDFQMSFEGTPVYDLSYFFYSGGSKQLFDKLETFLDIYYESFSKCAKALGGDPEKLLPREIPDSRRLEKIFSIWNVNGTSFNSSQTNE